MWPLEDSVVIERFSQSVQVEDGLTYFSSYFFNSEAFICSLSLFKKKSRKIYASSAILIHWSFALTCYFCEVLALYRSIRPFGCTQNGVSPMFRAPRVCGSCPGAWPWWGRCYEGCICDFSHDGECAIELNSLWKNYEPFVDWWGCS